MYTKRIKELMMKRRRDFVGTVISEHYLSNGILLIYKDKSFVFVTIENGRYDESPSVKTEFPTPYQLFECGIITEQEHDEQVELEEKEKIDADRARYEVLKQRFGDK